MELAVAATWGLRQVREIDPNVDWDARAREMRIAPGLIKSPIVDAAKWVNAQQAAALTRSSPLLASPIVQPTPIQKLASSSIARSTPVDAGGDNDAGFCERASAGRSRESRRTGALHLGGANEIETVAANNVAARPRTCPIPRR